MGAEVEVEPFMPDHGHAPPRRAVVMELDDGRYRAEPVTFHMNGFFTVEVVVIAEDKSQQSVQFGFCIP